MSLCANLSRLALLVVIVALGAVGVAHVSASTSPEEVHQATVSHQSRGLIGLLAQLTVAEGTVLPGGEIEFVATIDNLSGAATNNLEVAVTVTQQSDVLTYVEDSTWARFGHDGVAVRLSPLGEEPTLLLSTMEAEQQVRIEWDMAVDECASRDRWTEVRLQVWTDDFGQEDLLPLVVVARSYIVPHKLTLAGDLTADYTTNPSMPVPGAAVQHVIRVTNPTTTTARVRLRGIPEHASFCIAQERGGLCAPTRALTVTDRRPNEVWWAYVSANGQLTFEHPSVQPGNILRLSWTSVIPDDMPDGTAITSQVAFSSVKSHEGYASEVWTDLTTAVAVQSSHRELELHINNADADRSEPMYWPGERATLLVQVRNHTNTPAYSPQLTLSLPVAVQYVGGSGSYTTLDYSGGNARRLPDTWIDNGGFILPTVMPGQVVDVRFQLEVRADTAVGDLDVVALLQSGRREMRDTVALVVEPRKTLRMLVHQPSEVNPGDLAEYRVRVSNVGQADLEEVRFGIEGTCSATYEPHSLAVVYHHLRGARVIRSGDPSKPDSKIDGLDVTQLVGNLAAGETRDVVFTMHIADSLDAANIRGPAFVVFTDEAPIVGDRQEVELPVARQRAATTAELEATRDGILGEVRDVARDTQATANRTEELAEDIRETGEKTAELVTQTGTLANDIEDNTEAIKEQAGDIFDEVTEANPWSLGWKWVLLWGGFGALASLIAGFAVWFVLPPTLLHALAWFRGRQRQVESPYIPAPATPPVWRSPSQWWAAAVRASEPLVAALRRVRDWVDGLRRR